MTPQIPMRAEFWLICSSKFGNCAKIHMRASAQGCMTWDSHTRKLALLKGFAESAILHDQDRSDCFNSSQNEPFLWQVVTTMTRVTSWPAGFTTEYHTSLTSSHGTSTFASGKLLVSVTEALYASRLIAAPQFENVTVLTTIAQLSSLIFFCQQCASTTATKINRRTRKPHGAAGDGIAQVAQQICTDPRQINIRQMNGRPGDGTQMQRARLCRWTTHWWQCHFLSASNGWAVARLCFFN